MTSYYFQKPLIITDNAYLLKEFISICEKKNIDSNFFDYAYSFNNNTFPINDFKNLSLKKINVKKSLNIIEQYDLIFSIHCKQLFPAYIVNNVKCINIHPGLNPYNRGWYPQVFSIINGLPLGATIHEIDEFLDHGNIIAQEEIKLNSWDTSLSAYNRVLKTELKLIKENIDNILMNTYSVIKPQEEGNINYKKDFNSLCMIDKNETNTFGNFIDRLRALSHGQHTNAYFIDIQTGKKIYIKIELQPEHHS